LANKLRDLRLFSDISPFSQINWEVYIILHFLWKFHPFQLAYVDDAGKRTVKLVLDEAGFSLYFFIFLTLNCSIIFITALFLRYICTENFFQVKHVERRGDNLTGIKIARACHSHGYCTHFGSQRHWNKMKGESQSNINPKNRKLVVKPCPEWMANFNFIFGKIYLQHFWCNPNYGLYFYGLQYVYHLI
jgi:hypothetical protein